MNKTIDFDGSAKKQEQICKVHICYNVYADNIHSSVL